MTYTTQQINHMKSVIADRENILDIDVTDQMVFDYIQDMVDAEQLKRFRCPRYDASIDDYRFSPIRDRAQIIRDLFNTKTMYHA